MALSENVGYIPNEIAIKNRDFMIGKTIGFRKGYTIFRHTQMAVPSVILVGATKIDCRSATLGDGIPGIPGIG